MNKLKRTQIERLYWDEIAQLPEPGDGMIHFLEGDKAGKRKAIAERDEAGLKGYFIGRNGEIPLQVGTVLTNMQGVDRRFTVTVLGLGNLADKAAPAWRKYVVARTSGRNEEFKLDITRVNATGFLATQPAIQVKGELPSGLRGESALAGQSGLAGLTTPVAPFISGYGPALGRAPSSPASPSPSSSAYDVFDIAPQASGIPPAAQVLLSPQKIQEIVAVKSNQMAELYGPKTAAQRDQLQRIIYGELRNVNPGASALTVAALDNAIKKKVLQAHKVITQKIAEDNAAFSSPSSSSPSSSPAFTSFPAAKAAPLSVPGPAAARPAVFQRPANKAALASPLAAPVASPAPSKIARGKRRYPSLADVLAMKPERGEHRFTLPAA